MSDLGPVLHEFTAEIIAQIQHEVGVARAEADRRLCGVRLIFYPELIGWNIEVTREVGPGEIEVLRSHPA